MLSHKNIPKIRRSLIFNRAKRHTAHFYNIDMTSILPLMIFKNLWYGLSYRTRKFQRFVVVWYLIAPNSIVRTFIILTWLQYFRLWSKFCDIAWAFYFLTEFKIHIFWEGHKISRNLHQFFDWQYTGKIIGGDFAKFCGFLRICEL